MPGESVTFTESFACAFVKDMLSLWPMHAQIKSGIDRIRDFGSSRLAARMRELSPENGITSQAISQWTRVPAERVLLVEAATGISRHELRPDLYPPEPNGAAA